MSLNSSSDADPNHAMQIIVATGASLSVVSSVILIVMLILVTLHGSTEINFLTGQHSTRYLALLCLSVSDLIHAIGLVAFVFNTC